MRIARLDLSRYGKFTDYTIDFGARNDGEPDLHILYGGNEAGKTTIFSAYLDLLFGIEVRPKEKHSRYSFLHPEATMRIGAALELDSGIREFVRIKRPQNNLLDAADRPISEGVLAGELGGLDRVAYRAMFSLDDDTIESGGDSILQSKGDLGQLLFSASAGLSDLGRQLGVIREEAARFYKFRAHSGDLHELKKRLSDLKDERGRIDTLAPQYAQLVAGRATTKALYDAAIKTRGDIRARMDEITRLLNALPRMSALRALRGALAPLADLPTAPAGAAENLPLLQREEIDLAARLETAEREVARLKGEHDESVLDEAALAVGAQLDHLAGLRARYVTAAKDIPTRRLELRDAEHAVAGILDRLGHSGESEPKRLILSAATVGRLRSLIEEKAAVDSALNSAKIEIEAAKKRYAEASARHQEAGGAEVSADHVARMAAFAATVQALRDNDCLVRRRAVQREVDVCEITLGEKLRDLSPWTGSAEQLSQFPAPDRSVLDRWKSAIATAQKKADQNELEIERLDRERLLLEAELAALGRSTGIVDDAEANKSRAERDQAWEDHRRSLNAVSADTFEITLRRDDGIVQARFQHTSELLQLRQAEQGRAKIEAELGPARRALDTARATLDGLHGEIVAAFGALAPKTADEFSISQIETWLRRRDEALKAKSLLDGAKRDLSDTQNEVAAVRSRLIKAFAACSLPHDPNASLEDVLVAAQAFISDDMKRTSLRDAIDERRSDVVERERKLEEVSEADGDWRADWAKACKACWLGNIEHIPAVDEVREILEVVGGLGLALEKQSGFSDRIEKMEKDQADFSTEIVKYVAALTLAFEGDLLGAYSAIDARVQTAKTAAALIVKKAGDLERAEKNQRDLFEKRSLHEKRKEALLNGLGATTLNAAADILQKIKNGSDLQKQADEAASEIRQAVGKDTVEAAELALTDVDRPGLERELAELTGRYDDQDKRSQELFSDLNKAIDKIEAVGGDDAVARLEERRRTTLLQIEDGAQGYLRLRIGAAASEQALRVYRDQHRSSMMARAAEAFRTISRGTYVNLAAQPNKEGEILVAIAAEGRSKVADELSKGARFQLYLALRIAGYHEFVASRRPVPFIADDIMETFDDDRSAEALGLFAEIARIGQVIYMTHHPHLCEIARKICPTVKIHDL